MLCLSYDDTQSLTEKANYILSNGLAGGMFWALDLDDFTGNFCGAVKIFSCLVSMNAN